MTRDRLAVVGLSGVLALALSIVMAFLWFSRYGFDLTDEGYYLNWLANPGGYPASTTEFGFVYRPLYVVLDGSVPLLRAANVLIAVGLAGALTNQLLTRLLEWQAPIWERWAVSIAAAVPVTTVFLLGLLTPNYNTLAVQAFLLTAIGVVLAVTPDRCRTGWVLIAVGGTLVFFAKPTSAVVLGTLVVAVLLVAGTQRLRGLVTTAGVAVVVVLVAATLIDGSPLAFVTRLERGVEMLAVLGGGHDAGGILRWDPYDPTRVQVLFLVGVLLLLVGSAVALNKSDRLPRILGAMGGAAGLLLATSLTRGADRVFIWGDAFSPTVVLALPLAAAALVLLDRTGALRQITRPQWVLAVFFLVLPHASAFGTNTNYWRAAGQAAIFWVLAAIVLLAPIIVRPGSPRVLLPFLLAGQVLAVLIVLPGFHTPYRQPGPMSAYTERVDVRGSTLVVSLATAQHLRSTTKLVRAAGLSPGTPVLDLTGRSPGLLYAWGADSRVQPWSIGGYAGSVDHELLAIGRVSCDDLAPTWILTEPGGPRQIPERAVLANYGTDLDDFEVVASWITPAAVTASTPQAQQLHKPTRSRMAASTDCDQARAGQR